MAEIVLSDVSKSYKDVVAVRSTSLTVAPGELVTLLGPSGCGKTTTLRMIGGFVDVSSGRILVGGRDVTHLPPSRRNMGFVFQSYALFPHMTAAQNVAFGLEMRKVGRAETEKRVKEALARVRLGHLADRLPKELSGGQQQRVALARALVFEPSVLLLDEPLSNLDAKLRHEMKIEIRELQKSLGLTTIFVTHDQDEALSMSDRLVVMNAGGVEQVGSPPEVYERPASPFVADFMGFSNLLPVTVASGGAAKLSSGRPVHIANAEVAVGANLLALRAEDISVAKVAPDPAVNTVAGTVETATYRGAFVEYTMRLDDGVRLVGRGPAADPIAPGSQAFAGWTPAAGALMRAEEPMRAAA
jgi:putative spermidine/putrescine transport system ATP-binding protein